MASKHVRSNDTGEHHKSIALVFTPDDAEGVYNAMMASDPQETLWKCASRAYGIYYAMMFPGGQGRQANDCLAKLPEKEQKAWIMAAFVAYMGLTAYAVRDK